MIKKAQTQNGVELPRSVLGQEIKDIARAEIKRFRSAVQAPQIAVGVPNEVRAAFDPAYVFRSKPEACVRESAIMASQIENPPPLDDVTIPSEKNFTAPVQTVRISAGSAGFQEDGLIVGKLKSVGVHTSSSA